MKNGTKYFRKTSPLSSGQLRIVIKCPKCRVHLASPLPSLTNLIFTCPFCNTTFKEGKIGKRIKRKVQI